MIYKNPRVNETFLGDVFSLNEDQTNYKFMKYWVCYLVTCFLFSCDICKEMGAYELGNNLVLLEGDKREDRIIVFCTGRRSGGCCMVGELIVPAYNEHMNDGEYAEYVELTNFNSQWIIVKSIDMQNKENRYWIIDKKFNLDSINCMETKCDSLIRQNLTGPLDYNSFENKTKDLKIDLHFN